METPREHALVPSNEASLPQHSDQTADDKHGPGLKGWSFPDKFPKKIFQIVRSRSRSGRAGKKPQTERERRRSGYLARLASGRANRGHGGDSVAHPDVSQGES